MNQAAINEMRRQVLLNPTGTNIEQLINEIEKSGSEALKRDISFLRTLVPPAQQSMPESMPTPIPARNKASSLHRKPINTEAPSKQNATRCQISLKVPASAQWCFINGLGDMEWIQGACVRPCLEDRLLYAQALPSPKTFEVSITGKLQREPSLQIYTPFHNILFQVELEKTTDTGEWTTYRYRCSAEHNQVEDEGKDLIYELAFSVTAGDYFRELTCTF